MSEVGTELPRPAVGAAIRVLPTVDPPRHAGREGIVIGFDVPAPLLTHDHVRIIGEATWDLRVAFLDGMGSAYDMNEIEIVHDSPWHDADVSQREQEGAAGCPCGCPVVADMCSCPEPCPCEPDCAFCMVPNPMRQPDPAHVAREQQAERDDDVRAVEALLVAVENFGAWLAEAYDQGIATPDPARVMHQRAHEARTRFADRIAALRERERLPQAKPCYSAVSIGAMPYACVLPEDHDGDHNRVMWHSPGWRAEAKRAALREREQEGGAA